uniref:STI1 domain-containing protein n=1 Tax=Prymnesium polylepis TaxID=72548 RepID=A0A6T7WC59_9EUKA|mmetsp:Transcript_42618/g.117959  ORF Transcript_42618/g.117959 Transcript_42618/m.117959 type:complete len:174 (+) Transcript_42618:57-578(+)
MLLSLLVLTSSAYALDHGRVAVASRSVLLRNRHAAVRVAANDDEERAAISAMRVKQIKEELQSMQVQIPKDIFEKEDLVQRLIDARREQPSGDAESSAPPSMEESMQGLSLLLKDPEGAAVLQALERDPKLMSAAMDIAGNGNAADYADDPEVLAFLRKLESITKRAAAGGSG